MTTKLICPSCEKKATIRISDCRPADGGRSIRRRRECSSCGHRWTTMETPIVESCGEVETLDAMRAKIKLQLASDILDMLRDDGL